MFQKKRFTTMKDKTKIIATIFAAGAFTLGVEAPAYAYSNSQPIYLEVNQSYYLSQQSPVTHVTVSNPDLVNVVVPNKYAVEIFALGTGTSSVTVYTANGMVQRFTVNVNGSDTTTAEVIQKAIGLPHVQVTVIGDGKSQKILLKGTVANQYEKDLAYRIACMYAGGKAAPDKADDRDLFDDSVSVIDSKENNDNVINLLEMVNPDQINIEAEVIEINSDDARQLGATYGTDPSGSPGEFQIGESYGQIRDKGNHWYNRNWFFTHFSEINAKIHLLIEQGHGRVISRPNITTMSGKTAGILIGGQIPYPVSGGSDSGTTVQYKDYGIRLNLIEPTVDRSGNITSRVFASVSRLDNTNSVTVDGFNMPALATRTAETMVNIPTGMTMVIGGLLDSDDTKTIQKVPILGDIPIIGELFKYHNNTKNKSEILILITPRIVNETTPANMSPQMRDTYAQDRKDDEAREQVDLNGDRPKTNKELKDEAKAKETEVPPKKSEADDSILGKYLDQSVLKGTSKAEHDAAVKANQQE